MRPLQLLAIVASPRKQGNSNTFLQDTLQGLEDVAFPVEVSRYFFAGKQFGPCTGCLACYKNGGKCVVQDDYAELRQLWIDADLILYAFPIYALGMPGQLKCFLDRLGNSFYGYYEVSSVRHIKVIGALPQGGVSMGGQELSNQAVMEHAALFNSVYVSGDGAHVGSGAIAGAGGNRKSLLEKGEVQEPAYMAEVAMARNMLKRMVEMAAILQSGVLSLKQTLQQDPRYLPLINRLEEKS